MSFVVVVPQRSLNCYLTSSAAALVVVVGQAVPSYDLWWIGLVEVVEVVGGTNKNTGRARAGRTWGFCAMCSVRACDFVAICVLYF